MNVFENIKEFLIKYLGKLPSSPFSFDEYTENLESLLAHINYFIPFYKFATIFNVWVVCIISALIMYVVIRVVKKKVLGL